MPSKGKRVLREERASYPLPQAIFRDTDPEEIGKRDWVITAPDGTEPTPGMTSLATHEMIVPLDDSEESFAIRQHEMLHVAMSPLPPEGNDEGYDVAILAAEDGRIESAATAAGMVRACPIAPGEVVRKIDEFILEVGVPPGMGDFLAACMGVAGVGAPGDAKIRRQLALMGRASEKHRAVLAMMDRAAAAYAADESYASAEAVAAMLRELLPPGRKVTAGGCGQPVKIGFLVDEMPEGAKPSAETPDVIIDLRTQQQKQRQRERQQAQAEKAQADAAKAEAEADAAKAAALKPRGTGVLSRNPATGVPDGSGQDIDVSKSNLLPVTREDVQQDLKDGNAGRQEYSGGRAYGAGWNTLDPIAHPPLSVRIPPLHGGKRGRPSDYGVVPKRMDRMAVDYKVFASRRHKPQGTVLVDCSGSMSLAPEHLTALLEQVPAAVVATYNGRHGERGEIRVVAAGGRRCAEDQMPMQVRGYNSGNDVDGPAIHWLARQRGPRVWVSDGFVGSDHGLESRHIQDMAAVIRRARITQVVPGYRMGVMIADCKSTDDMAEKRFPARKGATQDDWVADVLRHLH